MTPMWTLSDPLTSHCHIMHGCWPRRTSADVGGALAARRVLVLSVSPGAGNVIDTHRASDTLCTRRPGSCIEKFYVVSPAVPNGAGDHRAPRTPPPGEGAGSCIPRSPPNGGTVRTRVRERRKAERRKQKRWSNAGPGRPRPRLGRLDSHSRFSIHDSRKTKLHTRRDRNW